MVFDVITVKSVTEDPVAALDLYSTAYPIMGKTGSPLGLGSSQSTSMDVGEIGTAWTLRGEFGFVTVVVEEEEEEEVPDDDEDEDDEDDDDEEADCASSSITCTRSLPVSATYSSRFFVSIAIPCGDLNLPSSSPKEPYLST